MLLKAFWTGLFSYSLANHCNRLLLASLYEKAWWEGMEMLEIFTYRTLAAVHFTNQNWILKTVYCIRCAMVCNISFTNWKAKIALLCVSMVVTYYIKILRTGADRHNGILMSLGHFSKHFVKNTKNWGTSGKHLGAFSPTYSQNYIFSGKFNSKVVTIRAFFSKIKTLFSIFKNGRGDLPSSSNFQKWQGRAPLFLRVAEYASVSLNIPKYPWKRLNKLFWLCQSSEYAWSCYIFYMLLKMPRVLNKPGFWIWHGCICKGYAEFWICLIIASYAIIMLLNMP